MPSSRPASDPGQETALLRRLLARLTSPERADGWAGLGKARLQHGTAAAYFLLDLPADGGVEQFTRYTLNRLFQHLAGQAETIRVANRGRLRGRISWSDTLKSRYSESYDPACFVCRENRLLYNTPENQLLKHVLRLLDQCLNAVPPALSAGICVLPGDDFSSHSSQTRLLAIRAAIANFRRHIRLREVSLFNEMQSLHLARAESNRVEEYAAVAHMYRRCQAMVAGATLATLRESGRRVLPLPASDQLADRLWLELAAEILWPES